MSRTVDRLFQSSGHIYSRQESSKVKTSDVEIKWKWGGEKGGVTLIFVFYELCCVIYDLISGFVKGVELSIYYFDRIAIGASLKHAPCEFLE